MIATTTLRVYSISDHRPNCFPQFCKLSTVSHENLIDLATSQDLNQFAFSEQGDLQLFINIKKSYQDSLKTQLYYTFIQLSIVIVKLEKRELKSNYRETSRQSLVNATKNKNGK